MTLKNILNIAQVDLQVYFADRNNLIGIIVMPLIFTLVIGFAFGGVGTSSNLVIDVIDLDNSDLSAQFVEDLRETNDTLLICPMDDGNGVDCALNTDGDDNPQPLTVEDTRERVAEERLSAGIVIPEGYAEAIRNFEDVQIDYYSLSNVTSGNDPVLRSVEAVIQRIDSGVIAARIGQEAGEIIDLYDDELTAEAFSEAVYDNATAQWQNPPVAVSYRLTQGTGENAVPGGFEQSVPGMATMFVMFTVLGGMQVLLRERQTWTLQRMIMMPVTRADILGGKIVSRFVLGVIQFLIVFAVGVFVGMDFGNNILGILLIIAAYTLVITALSFAIAPLFKDEFQAGTAVTLIALPLAAIGGAWWPLEIVPDFMRVIGMISPVSWAMDAFNQMIFYNGGWGDIVVPIAVLLIASGVLFVVGIVNFRYE